MIVPDGVCVTLPILSLCSLLFFVCASVLQYRMLDPGHIVESVTVEDPHEAMPIISVETNDDGTTRRTETTVSLL